MSIYPGFETPSIIERFNRDLEQFHNEYYLKLGIQTSVDQLKQDYIINNLEILPNENEILPNENYYHQFQIIINEIVSKITIIRTKNNSNNTNFENFDYAHEVIHLDPESQKEIWCLRTLLFYQLLIICTKMMSNISIFDDVYSKSSDKLNVSRTFKHDIISELSNYKMGIFGSITPTSDIDIGIQYSGNDHELIGLAYIISIFEDSFLLFTGRNSLHFDIETYANMMTLPNFDTATNSTYPDIFYLDTTFFEPIHFQQIKPYIEASILRNYVTAMIDTTNLSVEEAVKKFSYNDFNNYFENIAYKDYVSSIAVAQNIDIAELQPIINIYNSGNSMSEEAKNLIIEYMTSSYDVAREKYYELVARDEDSIKDVKEQNKNKNSVIKLDADRIATIIKDQAETLVYRAESYTCAPTVMHVVRVLQANKDNPNKYKTLSVGYCVTNKNVDAYCNIGKYGYIISIYEQLGYIYRFYLTYCIEGHKNDEKCSKKNTKYTERVVNALFHIKKIDEQPKLGGKKRKRTFITKGVKITKRRIRKRTSKRNKNRKTKRT